MTANWRGCEGDIVTPRQKIIPIGASRIQLSDEDWQGAVRKWLDDAQVIVFIAGITQWALWELGQVVTKGHAGKLIIVFPKVRSSWEYRLVMEERLTAIRRAFAGSAWEMGLAEIRSPGAIRSISFEPTGRGWWLRADPEAGALTSSLH